MPGPKPQIHREEQAATPTPTPAVVPHVGDEKQKPVALGRDGHAKLAADLASFQADAEQMVVTLTRSYAKTTEPPRRARAIVQAVMDLKNALVGKYFSERLSTDGRNPYYTQEALTQGADSEEEPDDAA